MSCHLTDDICSPSFEWGGARLHERFVPLSMVLTDVPPSPQTANWWFICARQAHCRTAGRCQTLVPPLPPLDSCVLERSTAPATTPGGFNVRIRLLERASQRTILHPVIIIVLYSKYRVALWVQLRPSQTYYACYVFLQNGWSSYSATGLTLLRDYSACTPSL